MSECGVCIGGYEHDGPPEFFATRWPKARTGHKCGECRRTILKGEVYHRCSGKFEGDFFDDITCAQCAEIREAFTCAGYDETGPPQGQLWSDIEGVMFPHLTTACFDKLATPEAKAFLRRRWMEWKGLTVCGMNERHD
jgi:hypothetical protein